MAGAFAAGAAWGQVVPTGGVAIHGQASISAPAPNQLVVTTTNGAGTGHSAINWQSFSLSAGSSARFVQPSAASLSINRVVTNTPSAIFGNLSSNGRLVLVNQSGITVGAGAVVDTAGFTASALRMTDADALAGRLRFGASGDMNAMGGAAGLTVDGRITARDGDVVLIAPRIDVGTSALVQSPNGSTILAAGQQVEITGRGLEGISLLVQARDNEARNLGRLEGDAVGIFAGTLRHSGAIQATTASLEGGTVVLKATGDSYVEGSGSIIAKGTRGGTVDVLGNRVAVKDQAMIDVSGAQGGGTMRIGGDYQGKNPDVPNAARTYLGPEAVLRADAVESGDGGRVIVWADDLTKAYGSISARGGAMGGGGGFVEVSGKHGLVFEATVDLRAPFGKLGTLLLDPDFIDIVNGGSDPASSGDEFTDGPSNVSISPDTLNAVGGNVMLQSDGDITFSDPVNLTTPGASLTALTGNMLLVDASITTNGGDILLYSAAPGALGTGTNDNDAIYVNAAITSNGGTIELTADSCNLGCDSVVINANVNAGAGTIFLNGLGDVRQTALGVLAGGSLFVNADSTIILDQLGNNIPGDVNLFTNVGTGGSSSVTFRNSAGSFNLNGAVAKGNVSLDGTGTMTTDGVIESTTGNVSIVFVGGMNFGDEVLAAGTLTLGSTNSIISQTGGGLTVAGASTVNAGAGDIDLTSLFNNMSTVSLTGGHITLFNAGSLTVTSLSQTADSNLYLESGGVLSLPAGAINRGTGQLSLLSGAGNLSTPGALSGSDLLLSGQGGLTLAHTISATGTLSMFAGGSVTQTAGAIVALGGTVVDAGLFNVTLTQAGNDFSSIGATGGAVSITDTNGVVLNDADTSGLTVNASGNVTQNAALLISGTTTINAGSGNVTLTAPGNNLNQLNVSGNALNIVEGAGSALTVLSLSSGLNQPVTLAAGHNLTLPAATIDTGTADLTLSSGNTLTILGPLLGNNIDLSAVAGVVVGGPIDASGNLDATVTGGASTMTVNQTISAGADMTLTLAGNLSVLAGSDGLVGLTAGGNQTITAGGNILLQAGGSGDSNAAVIETTGAGTQSVTANGITVLGGAGGGGLGIGNYASIRTAGSQTVTVGNGGIVMTGGGGTLSENYANIEQNGGAGTTQSITINGTGSIVLTGGSALGDGSHASILTDNGDSQTITFTGGGAGRAITLTGGTNGSDAYAEIYAGTGTQTITGAGLITLTGGASGGGASFGGGDTLGNLAAIGADANDQTITASGIVLQGGAAGLNNLAGIFGGGDQSITVGAGGLSLAGGGGGGSDLKNAAILWKGSDVPGTTQTIMIGGGGSVTLQGGSASGSNVGTDADFGGLSNGAFAAIRSDGVSQLIEFTAPGGSIQMTGGTLGSDNHAMILAQTGTQTVRGSVAANAPALVLTGGASGGLGGTANEGNRALIFSVSGNQDVTARSIGLTGGASGNENLAQIRQGDASNGLASTQTITVVGGGDITMQGGNGNTNFARIRSFGPTQTVNFTAGGTIDLTGGSGGIDSFAQIVAHNGDQFVTGADGITLLGGSAGNNNRAQITSLLGSQTLTVGGAGLSMTGGSGAIGDIANWASVFQGGTAGTSQTITVDGGGDITLQAGSSASSGIGVNNGSLAYITSQGDQQLVEFSAPGSTISITGGTVGSYNSAGFYAFNGDQVIRGTAAANAPAIVMTGGASGGIAGEGNFAELTAALGSQTLQAASIALAGGVAGTDNLARISQLGTAGTSQAITIVSAGTASLLGGAGVTNLAQFRSLGDTQTVDFAAGGSLTLTGGIGASLNYARIEAVNGNQEINGAPVITITGGASGGAAGLGNFAQIRARPGTQLVTATSLGIVGGAGGIENDAGIRSDGNQTISLQTAGSNAVVIGDATSANVSFITGTNQVITAGAGAQSGSITIRGGTTAGKNAGIFANPITPNTGTQTISTTGTLSLTGGSATGTASTCDNTAGSGSCAHFNNDGTGLQRITANTLLVQGGNAGLGSGAGIFGQGGNMELDIGAGGLTMLGGSGGTSNFASIGGSNASGSTMTIDVVGNTVLDARNGTDGSGAFIGLGGTAAGGSITIDFNGTGNLTLFGSNVSPLAGAGIGTGSNRTGASANITIDAADVMLNAGSQSSAGIGHRAGNGGLGNIGINATTGDIGFNANGSVQAGVRTGDNVTLVAGGSILQNASATNLPSIEANLLTATANGGPIMLDSTANAVGTLNATVPFFDDGDILFTNGPGLTLTVSGITMAGTGRLARITADDIQLTGAVSNPGGTVVLRPLDLARNVHVENSPTAGVLSLSPADLQRVTNANVLEIGRLDGTGNLLLGTGLANTDVGASTLRLLTGSDFFTGAGAGLGAPGTEFNHHVEVRANNDLSWTQGGVLLVNNRSLSLYADNDGDNLGSVNIGAVTLQVGTDVNNGSGTMDIKGADITIAVSGGGFGLVRVTGTGSQTLTSTVGDMTLTNANVASGSSNIETESGTQTLSATSGTLSLQAGIGAGTGVVVGSTSGSQIVNADRLELRGGASGTNNSSTLFARGAAQTITVGAGGMLVQGGGGTGADGNNSAFVVYSGTGAQTITVNGAGNLDIIGGSSALQSVGTGNGSRAGIETQGTGNQTITLTGGDLTLQGGSVGSRNYAAIFADLASQTITGVDNLIVLGGDDGGVETAGNRATIQAGINQTISASNILLIGGDEGTENYARFLLYGPGALTQSVSAFNSLTLTGGADGGGIGTANRNIGNRADLISEGSQNLTVGAGGITMTAGGGSLTNNQAQIFQSGTTGTSQTITVNAGGSISLTGGSSAGTNVGSFNGSRAILQNSGDSQLIDFTAGGALTLTGGTVGGRNFALVYSGNGSQTIQGATSIDLTGGANGGIPGESNWAQIQSEGGAQTISAGSITLTGGAGGVETLAAIRQGTTTTPTTANQTITIGNGGSLSLFGGGGTTSFARVQAFGSLQTLAFGTGSTLDLTGGTGASNNFARVQAVNGNQTINGNPTIAISGGASGGADLAGNFADIRASGAGATQTLNANTLLIQAGAAGQENFAGVMGANQTITVVNDVGLIGGGSSPSLDGTSGGGARIGGSGDAATNLTLSLGGDLTLTGGSVAGAVLGSSLGGGQPTIIIATAGGDITLNPGSAASAGSRIGSPASAPAAGDIFLSAGGTIALGGSVAGETTIRTLGDVTLDASTLAIGNLVTGATVFANATGATAITGVGQISASALSGDAIELVTGTSFSNSAGASALVTTAPARWLVYSADPALDARGGLVYDFKQYDKTFGDATPIAGTGNGFLYGIAPTVNVSLTGIVSKVYDGTDVATIAAGNFLVTGGLVGDVVSVNSGATGDYDNRNVGIGKTVSVSGVTISALDGTAPVFGYALAGGTATGPVGTITTAPLTVSTGAVNKSYDATTAAPGAAPIVTAGALGSGDTLSGGVFAFLDPNVGTGKTVTVSGVNVNDGNGGANYAVSFANNTVSSITELAASTWSGLGGDNLWSNPANWDVLPITGNVLSAAIPAGTGTVVFDAAAGTTSLQSLSSQQAISVTGGSLVLGTSFDAPSLNQSGGALQVGTSLATGSLIQSAGTLEVGASLTTNSLVQSAGTLQVGTSLTTGSLAQSGGNLLTGGNVTAGSFTQGAGATLSGAGALTVSSGFGQSGGSVTMGSNISVNQSSGDLVTANLAAPSITLAAPAGAIIQTGALSTAALSTQSATGTNLNLPANQIGTLVASNSGAGDIVLVNASPLTLGAIANAGGSIMVTNTGAIDSVGPVTAPAGSVTIIANSPLTVGSGGITAGGDIVLHATNLTSAGNLTLNGALLAGNTVSLTADANLVQNFAVVGANGVTATAAGSMTYGPLATTNAPPILYMAGGVSVAPPPTVLASALQAPGDVVVTFLELLQQAIDGPRGDALETNPDGSKKRKDEDEGIVTEEELCR